MPCLNPIRPLIYPRRHRRWTFAPWRGVFYPDGLPHAKELGYAASHLTSIENQPVLSIAHRHRRPSAKWASEVPDGFIFSVKGPRYVTHRAELKEAGASIERFLNSGVIELGDSPRAACCWQFPPFKKFKRNGFRQLSRIIAQGSSGIAAAARGRSPPRSFCVPGFIHLLRKFETAVVFSEHETYPAIADVDSRTSCICAFRRAKTHCNRLSGRRNRRLGRAPACLDRRSRASRSPVRRKPRPRKSSRVTYSSTSSTTGRCARPPPRWADRETKVIVRHRHRCEKSTTITCINSSAGCEGRNSAAYCAAGRPGLCGVYQLAGPTGSGLWPARWQAPAGPNG